MEARQSDEVEPLVGLDDLAIAELVFSLADGVVSEFVNDLVGLVCHCQEAVVRRVFVLCVLPAGIPKGSEALFVMRIAVVSRL